MTDVHLTPALRQCLHEIERRDAQVRDLMSDLYKSENALASLARDDNYATLINRIKAPVLRQIILANLRNQDRPPRGRRWTEEDKENALLIYKNSPKAYRLIEKMFTMPSIRSVSRVLRKIPITVGLNTIVLEEMKRRAATLCSVDRECTLMFDEMSIKERLVYREGSSRVMGFEDFGNGDISDRVANRALVFMLQGIATRYKMPIAFYFVRGTVSSERLSTLIPKIVRAINATGLNVAATVCDAGSTNRGAWRILNGFNSPDRPGPYFVVDDRRIIWLWDGPHLWKAWKNNISGNWEHWLEQNKSMKNITKFQFPGNTLIWNGQQLKWRYIMDLYTESVQKWGWKKITEGHVLPTNKEKMRVKYTTQVFSNTIAAFLRCSASTIVEHSQKRGVNVSTADIMEAADIIDELDDLIDSMNGCSSQSDPKANTSRANVSNSSHHLGKWAKFRKTIQHVQFIRWDGKKMTPACQKNTIHSLSALQDLWQALNKKGFRELHLRNINQDPLENTFGQIRQTCGDNRNPTVEQFEASMKTLHVTKFLRNHAPTANCEEDTCHMLVTLKHLLKKSTPVVDEAELFGTDNEEAADNPEEHPDSPPSIHPQDLEEEDHPLEIAEATFTTYIFQGFMTSKGATCDTCAECLQDTASSDVFSASGGWLRMIQTAIQVWNDRLSTKLHNRNLPNVFHGGINRSM